MNCGQLQCCAFLQSKSFWAYLPSHTNNVAAIILGSSINALAYNLVRGMFV